MTLSGPKVQSILLRIAPVTSDVSFNCATEDYLVSLPRIDGHT